MGYEIIAYAIIGGLAYALTGYYKAHSQEHEDFNMEKFGVTIFLATVLGVIGTLTGYNASSIIDGIVLVAPTFAGATVILENLLKVIWNRPSF
jgi:hypothetical protein